MLSIRKSSPADLRLLVRELFVDDRGTAVAEYALVMAVVTLGMITTTQFFRMTLSQGLGVSASGLTALSNH